MHIKRSLLIYSVLLLLAFLIPKEFIFDNYVILFPIFMGIYLSLFVSMIKRSIKRDIFSPDILFILFFSGYTLILPLISYYVSIFYFDSELARFADIVLDPKITTYAFYLCVLALVAFLLGYRSIETKRPDKEREFAAIDEKDKRNLLFLFIVFVFIPILFLSFLFSIYKMGFYEYIFQKYSLEFMAGPYWGMLGFSLEFLSSLLIIWLLLILNSKGKEKKMISWAMFVFLIVILLSLNTLHGTRIIIMGFGLSVLLVYNSYIRRIKLKTAIIFAIVVILFFSFVGIYRSTREMGFKFGMLESFHSVYWESTLNFYTFLLKLDFFEKNPSTPYLNGLGFIDGFINILPRPFYSDKEDYFFTTKWLTENKAYDYISPTGGSFILGELYINGGKLCITFFFIFFGYLLAKIYNYFVTIRSFVSQIIYFIGIPLLIIHTIRDPLAITIKLFLEHVLLLALVAHLILVCKKSHNLRNT